MKRILFILALVMAIVADAYCGYIYESEIQSFGNYDMEGKTFYVISADPKVSNKDLEFQDYKDYITQCLMLKNAIPCENSDSADVCILFDYGLVDKSYVANVAIPIWGITGATFITTTSRYIGGNGILQTSNTIGTLNTGITGIFNKTETVEEYRRVINLYAYDNKDRTSDPVMLWKTNVSSQGTSRDLQEVIPYIAYSAIPHMGKQTNGIKTLTISPCKIEVSLIREKYYLEKGISLVSTVKETNGLPLEVHSISQDEWSTSINIISKKMIGVFSFPTFKRQTYLVCNGQKYPIIGLYNPCDGENLLGQGFELNHGDNWLLMRFHTLLQKGDTFDIISYKNKKETKVYVHFKNVVVK